jgi:iron complex outermembrane receptor protein
VDAPADLDVGISDHRDFVGPYASVEYSPFERLVLSGGVRLNITRETESSVDAGAGTSETDERTPVRASGSLGALVNLWQGQQDSVALFANYRDTFKPAAIDFGIGEDEENGGAAANRLILAPETSRSVEGGLKARLFQRRMEAEASGFYMRFSNLVSAATVGGVPALINTGKQRFAGFESSVGLYLHRNIIARANYSYHDAIFTDFIQDFDGVPTDLAGHRLEMSARHLAALGLAYAPEKGWCGSITLNYTGNRFLNRENTGLAGGFATLDVNAGYRRPRWEIRLYGRNLSDARDPVATSELGEGQYYLMPARSAEVRLRLFF